MIDITSRVAELVPEGMKSGLCHVFAMHTTAGITINENADPDVADDILSQLEELAPHARSSYRHGEGNSDSHVKCSLVGTSQTIAVRDGRLLLGVWQGIYFCEFDGPRTRTVEITFI